MSQNRFNEHRPGFVYSVEGFTSVRKGQIWHYLFGVGDFVAATVEGVEDGAVFLRPQDEAKFRQACTRQEANKHGTLVDVLPFKEMGTNFKKPDEWKNGTFAAHEAWHVWNTMRLSA